MIIGKLYEKEQLKALSNVIKKIEKKKVNNQKAKKKKQVLKGLSKYDTR